MPLKNIYKLLRFLFVIFSIILLIFCLFYLFTYTYPFFFALLIAFLLNPLVNFLELRFKFNRPLATFLSILFVLVIIMGVTTFLIIELINGTTYLAVQIPYHFKTLVTFIQDLVTQHVIPVYQKLTSMISMLDPNQQNAILNNVQNMGDNLASSGAVLLQQLLQQIPSLLSNLPSYLSVLVFSFLGTFFISKDWYKLRELFLNIIPKSFSTSGSEVFKGLKKALFGFIKAQIILISITAIIVLIGLLCLQVEHAITIAIITGLIDLLPYLGTGLIFIPWILYMFLTGNYFLTIGLSILYFTVVIQRQLMEPKVLSNNIGLNPLATLISLFAGFQLWGLLGLMIGPVILVILNTLYQTGVIEQLWLYINGNKNSH
ncbi:sporulation integral membrane protein YtvI [Aquibacillus rhizosphaerae]|uniref:Sporulation integral membrane protein YtvI n=1 Tax=Aquibacillus rhizosphaerae TaxID=3051431 RepID=A0ABT7L461_9BACI|nr:sporulation integral membrane protein YtvI [Aquibacillus sp. LR5S19]MDL4840662.1 sporulation integral membrane protein YtvI [Aquibacillus sp. LR5S19]